MRSKMALIMVLIFMMFIVVPAFAETTSKGSHPVKGSSKHSTAIREHTHEYTDKDTIRTSDYEYFDYGAHVNLEYGLEKWLTLDLHNSYFHKTQELRSTVGVTFKFGKK